MVVNSATARKVSLGVCCMAAKAASPPMQAILRRLEICGDFDISVFKEEDVLEKPAAEWPVVECLIAFASTGFPQAKCEEYCKLRSPKCINDVLTQRVFRSRSEVYKTLTASGVPCPDYIAVDHSLNGGAGSPEFEESENYVMYRGKKIMKPFVEKPEDGDRHDIWIYYPRSVGGGAKKLFRKRKDQSSEYDENQNQIRRDGMYIYEPFLTTGGTDIKVYTVGEEFAHGEARKAPTVDGKVNRSKDGKEVRYPVNLSQDEKGMAQRIVNGFRQFVCGFDILRTDGGSVVCDVNGWSFVKGNQKYYNDCATLIRRHLLEQCGVAARDDVRQMILGPADEKVFGTTEESKQEDYSTRKSLINEKQERLRSVIVVMRHGDRRPKEKMKFKCTHPRIAKYFEGTADEAKEGEIRLKTPEEMEDLKRAIEETRRGLQEQLSNPEVEKAAQLEQELSSVENLIPVLEMQDRFSGLERKVQLKPSWKQSKDGFSRYVSQVQVVAKWGGELTRTGLEQSEVLGHELRKQLYPNDPEGLIRLHSSFRHDFKIYSSQEGRCQITAAAFTKGFLDLEGDVIPILVSLVQRGTYAQDLLDHSIPKKLRGVVKQKIESLLMSYNSMATPEACPTEHVGLKEAARQIGNPLQNLNVLRSIITEYVQSITDAKAQAYKEMCQAGAPANHDDEAHDDAVPLGDKVPLGIPDMPDSAERRWLHLKRKENRWRKLLDSFVRADDGSSEDVDNVYYDSSKIPDVWDNIYYDMTTHRHYLGSKALELANMMKKAVTPFNEWVALSEYGISQEEKLKIGVGVAWRLLGKVKDDLEFMIADVNGRTDLAGQFLPRPVNVATPCPSEPGNPGGAGRSQNGDLLQCSQGLRRTTSIDEEAPASPALSNGYPSERRRLFSEAAGAAGPLQADDEQAGVQRSLSDLSNANDKRRSKLSKLTPEVRSELSERLRDSSDWHPRLNHEVARLNGIKHTRIVRSRVYVTSASTMHSLVNILRHARIAGLAMEQSNLDRVTDLNYLSHIVFRCYERDDAEADDADCSRAVAASQARYRVEISFSPGIQPFDEDGELKSQTYDNDQRPQKCYAGRLHMVARSCELQAVEKFINEITDEFCRVGVQEEDDEEKHSDN